MNVLLDMEYESLANINALAQAAGALSTDDIKKLGAAVTLAKSQNAEQVKNLAENLDLFDFAPGAFPGRVRKVYDPAVRSLRVRREFR